MKQSKTTTKTQVWVSKYTDTRGVFSCDARITDDGKYAADSGKSRLFLRLGSEAFLEEKNAQKRGAVILQRKITALDKKRADLCERLQILNDALSAA